MTYWKLLIETIPIVYAIKIGIEKNDLQFVLADAKVISHGNVKHLWEKLVSQQKET